MGIIDRLFPENDEGSLGKIVKVSDRGGKVMELVPLERNGRGAKTAIIWRIRPAGWSSGSYQQRDPLTGGIRDQSSTFAGFLTPKGVALTGAALEKTAPKSIKGLPQRVLGRVGQSYARRMR